MLDAFQPDFKEFNDIHINMDYGRSTVVVLLCLSTVFGPVDHNILLKWREGCITWKGESCLKKTPDIFVSIGNISLKWTKIICGVPQGSTLGTLLFNVYMLLQAQIIKVARLVTITVQIIHTRWLWTRLSTEQIHRKEINMQMSYDFLQLTGNKTEVTVWTWRGRSRANAQLSGITARS